MTGPIKKSVTIARHRTSVSLEPVFWRLLEDAAEADGISANALVAKIDATRDGNLSSALRVYLVTRFLPER